MDSWPSASALGGGFDLVLRVGQPHLAALGARGLDGHEADPGAQQPGVDDQPFGPVRLLVEVDVGDFAQLLASGAESGASDQPPDVLVGDGHRATLLLVEVFIPRRAGLRARKMWPRRPAQRAALAHLGSISPPNTAMFDAAGPRLEAARFNKGPSTATV